MIFAVLFFSALVASLGFAWGRLDAAQQIIRSHIDLQGELSTDLYRVTFYQGVIAIVIAAGIIAGSIAVGWPAGVTLAAAAYGGRSIGNRMTSGAPTPSRPAPWRR